MSSTHSSHCCSVEFHLKLTLIYNTARRMFAETTLDELEVHVRDDCLQEFVELIRSECTASLVYLVGNNQAVQS
jgi:hypothetical protein